MSAHSIFTAAELADDLGPSFALSLMAHIRRRRAKVRKWCHSKRRPSGGAR